MVVSYIYDAWGKVYSVTGSMADTLGTINPIRYRSYYYDTETGFYYLNSRYYDPEIKRFINADSQLSMGSVAGTNLFAYCGNNPINMTDSMGNWPKWIENKVNSIGNFFSGLWNSVKNWWNGTGSRGSEGVTHEVSYPYKEPETSTGSQQAEGYSTNIPSRKPSSPSNNTAHRTTPPTRGPIDPKGNVLAKSAEVTVHKLIEVSEPVMDFVIDRFSTPEKAVNTLETMEFTGNVIGSIIAFSNPPVGGAIMLGSTILFGGSALIIKIINE